MSVQTELKLRDYLASGHTQSEAARLLGLKYQATVSKMLASDRDVRLVFHSDGTFSHSYEVKRLNGSSAA